MSDCNPKCQSHTFTKLIFYIEYILYSVSMNSVSVTAFIHLILTLIVCVWLMRLCCTWISYIYPYFLSYAFSVFHQMLKVVNVDEPLTTIVLSHSTWILLALLLILVLAAGGILYRWRENNKLQNQSQNNFHTYNGVSSSAQYQANQQEVNMVQGGILNPAFDRTAM